MARLAAAFLDAAPPTMANLEGTWVEVRSVATHEFGTGQSGPDRVSFDSTGLREKDVIGQPLRAGEIARRPFQWAVTFTPALNGQLAVRQLLGDGMPRRSTATLAPGGNLTFSPEVDADVAITLDCRAPDARTLVCLDLEHVGSGNELRKLSIDAARELESRYRPVPLDTARVAGVLVQGTVCYHSAYPLSHVSSSAYAVDTWLVLGGDLQAPVGQRLPAVVLDDSDTAVAEWWRSTTGAGVSDARKLRWNPGRIEIVIQTVEHDLRGTFAYTDSEMTGAMIDYTDGRGWGVDAQRRPCPARRPPPAAED